MSAAKKTEAITIGSTLGLALGIGAGVTLDNTAAGIGLGVVWALTLSAGIWAHRPPATTSATSS